VKGVWQSCGKWEILAKSSEIFCADVYSEKKSTAAVQVLPGAHRTLANNPHPLHNDGSIRPEGTSRLSVKEMARVMQVNHQSEHQSRLIFRAFLVSHCEHLCIPKLSNSFPATAMQLGPHISGATVTGKTNETRPQ